MRIPPVVQHFFLVGGVIATVFLTACAPSGWTCADQLEYRSAELSQVQLNTACMGDGPPVVFLHGFPEFHYAWVEVMEALADSYTVMAPDQRGYNLSSIPPDLEDYQIQRLTRDIREFLQLATGEPALLVAHDWGAAVGWLLAHQNPELLQGLIIINGPHPDVFVQRLQDDPDQLDAAQYMNSLISPLSEAVLSANDYEFLASGFEGILSPDQLLRYREAWAVEGAITGMVNWYRANIIDGPAPANHFPSGVSVDLPTLVMWGMDDSALLPSNLAGLDDWVPDLEILEIPDADHWVVHQKTEEVSSEIRRFAAAQFGG